MVPLQSVSTVLRKIAQRLLMSCTIEKSMVVLDAGTELTFLLDVSNI